MVIPPGVHLRSTLTMPRALGCYQEYIAAHLALLRKRLVKFPDLEPVPSDKRKAGAVTNENSL